MSQPKGSRSKGSSTQPTPDGSDDDDDYAPVVSSFGKSRRANDDYVRPALDQWSLTMQVDEETEVEDDRLYCLCRQRYNPDRLMIACDRCAEQRRLPLTEQMRRLVSYRCTTLRHQTS